MRRFFSSEDDFRVSLLEPVVVDGTVRSRGRRSRDRVRFFFFYTGQVYTRVIFIGKIGSSAQLTLTTLLRAQRQLDTDDQYGDVSCAIECALRRDVKVSHISLADVSNDTPQLLTRRNIRTKNPLFRTHTSRKKIFISTVHRVTRLFISEIGVTNNTVFSLERDILVSL